MTSYVGTSDAPAVAEPYGALLAQLALSDAEAKTLTDEELVRRLVDSGLSRLTGQRLVELGRGSAEPGRARLHAQSRPR
jgi:hypothetical protein